MELETETSAVANDAVSAVTEEETIGNLEHDVVLTTASTATNEAEEEEEKQETKQKEKQEEEEEEEETTEAMRPPLPTPPSDAALGDWYSALCTDLTATVYDSTHEDSNVDALDQLVELLLQAEPEQQTGGAGGEKIDRRKRAELATGLDLLVEHGGQQDAQTGLRCGEMREAVEARHYWRFALGAYGSLCLTLDAGRSVWECAWRGQVASVERCGAPAPVSLDCRVLASLVSLPESQLLTSSWQPSAAHWLGHALCVDHDAGELVLCVRGTFFATVAARALCRPLTTNTSTNTSSSSTTLSSSSSSSSSTSTSSCLAPFLNGYAHAGLLRAARALLATLTPTLLHYAQAYPGYGLVCTGHGLGGSVAALFTGLLHQQRQQEQDFPQQSVSGSAAESETETRTETTTHGTEVETERSSSGRSPSSLGAQFGSVRCFAYGPAACVTAEVVPRLKRVVNCYVQDKDPLPRLSVLSARVLTRMALSFARDESLNSWTKRLWASLTKSNMVKADSVRDWYDDSTVPRAVDTLVDVLGNEGITRMVDQQLFSPGQVLFMRYRRPIRYGFRRCTMELSNALLYSEIIPHKEMFQDALPTSYDRGLEGVENDICLHQRIPSPKGLRLRLTDKLRKLWDSSHLDPSKPLSFWAPELTDEHEYFVGHLADTAQSFARYPAGDTFALVLSDSASLPPTAAAASSPDHVVPVLESSVPPPLAIPTGFELVWSDKRSGFFGTSGRCWIWRPIAPSGYLSLGYVVTTTSDTPLDATFPRLRCVHHSLVCESEPLLRLWSSQGSGVLAETRGDGVTICLVHPQDSGIHPGHTFTILPHVDGQEDKPTHPIYWFLPPDPRTDSSSSMPAADATTSSMKVHPLHSRGVQQPGTGATSASEPFDEFVPGASSAESHFDEL